MTPTRDTITNTTKRQKARHNKKFPPMSGNLRVFFGREHSSGKHTTIKHRKYNSDYSQKTLVQTLLFYIRARLRSTRWY